MSTSNGHQRHGFIFSHLKKICIGVTVEHVKTTRVVIITVNKFNNEENSMCGFLIANLSIGSTIGSGPFLTRPSTLDLNTWKALWPTPTSRMLRIQRIHHEPFGLCMHQIGGAIRGGGNLNII